MTKCEYCEPDSRLKVYEDDKVVAVLSDKPAAIGHILLMPKEHYPIIEQVPDYVVNHLFIVANKLSIVAFESLNAMGSNIIVNNGVAAGQKSSHFMVHIIPRRENDGINIQWQPQQISAEELSTVELQIKEKADSIGGFEEEKPAPIIEEDAEEIEGNNLQVQVLNRCP